MKHILILSFSLFFFSNILLANKSELFALNEISVEQQFEELSNLELQISLSNFEFVNAKKSTLSNVLLLPDNDAKTSGDSFFKGFTLGCIGIADAYLEDDRDKYKRGPMWTGCCLHNIILGTVLYLLNANYFHLDPLKQ